MIFNINFHLLIVIWSVLSVSCLDFHPPYVKTPVGGIKGYYKQSAERRQYAAYEGIPYALPPVGELRFQVKELYLKISHLHITLYLKLK